MPSANNTLCFLVASSAVRSLSVQLTPIFRDAISLSLRTVFSIDLAKFLQCNND